MSEYDKADRDVIGMCNENRRRSKITTTIGYIVPQKEAHEMAVEKAVGNRSDGVGALLLITAQLFVLVTAAVVALS